MSADLARRAQRRPPDLDHLARRLERAPAQEIVAWAVDRFGPGLALAASFQDCVLIDVAVQVEPAIPVLFLDTGFHFPETLRYVETVRERYQLNLLVVGPEVGPSTWPCGTEWCCQVRKVEPLSRALGGRGAWMSGIRRAETPERADTPVLQWDTRREMVKVNPLATWNDADVAAYQAEHDLPMHPLATEGYASIGCAPTTSPVAAGEDPRAGRWRESDKTECGLHADES